MARPKPTTDREMILSPDSWPKWPVLPLVKRGPNPKCAIIYGDPGKDGTCLFIEDAFIFRPDSWKDGVHKNVDEILADGWVVD